MTEIDDRHQLDAEPGPPDGLKPSCDGTILAIEIRAIEGIPRNAAKDIIDIPDAPPLHLFPSHDVGRHGGLFNALGLLGNTLDLGFLGKKLEGIRTIRPGRRRLHHQEHADDSEQEILFHGISFPFYCLEFHGTTRSAFFTTSGGMISPDCAAAVRFTVNS